VIVDIERDFWLSAEEAITYGIVSRVIERHSDIA
jgi:ATP-dependent Clp protease protease subunit